MTIYAIVNPLLPSPKDYPRPIWTLISPAGILQGGNPYFVPDFAKHFEARVALAVRIGKLGKGIAGRFASRYVEAVAPAVLFTASDLLRTLKEEGLPWTSAISYDRCLAIGKFINLPFDEIPACEYSIGIRPDGAEEETIRNCIDDAALLATCIETISRDNTLKTGDILLVGLSGESLQVMPDMRVTLKINGYESPGFNIR
ncbi:MAG: fumarylacetoacetate hydrolase family protein [Muribaculaceae bacterium]|nr:fumarylacetoacetate hydrolase family protein [Muribaculaceae bacterium]